MFLINTFLIKKLVAAQLSTRIAQFLSEQHILCTTACMKTPCVIRYLMLIFRLYLKIYTPPSYIFNNLEDLAVSEGHTTWKSIVLLSA